MGKLQTGRFERLAARTYSIKGPGALVDLDESVLGVLQLERQGGMESHYMQGWETFGAYRELGALGPANYTYYSLSNPVGSGRIAVFDWYQRNDATRIEVFTTIGILPGSAVAAVGDPLDSRIPRARQPAIVFNYVGTAAASFGTQVAMSASTEKQHFPVVLAEDGTLVFRSSAKDESFTISLRWAEREAQPFEQ